MAGATTKNQSQTSQKALENLMSFCHGPQMSNARCLEKFNELVSIVDHFRMELGIESNRVYSILANDPAVVDPDAPTTPQLIPAKMTACNEYLAVLFLCKSDPK